MHPAAGVPGKQQGGALPVQRLVLLPAKAVGEVGAIQFGALAQQAGQFGVAQRLAAQQMATLMAGNFPRLLSGKPLLPFQYRDRGSLVSLSKFSSVGHLMVNFKEGQWFIEGWLARSMYISLYRLHQAALYGWPRTLLLLIAGRFNRLVRPRLKLH